MRLILGVDPAQKWSGYAYRIDEGPITAGHFFGIENLGGLEVPLGPDVELYACIECPRWAGPGTRETRAAAIAWERFLLKHYPKRRIWFVDPRQWQSLLLAGCPGQTTKARALWCCARMLQLDVCGDHEADAACLMQFAWLKAEGLVDVEDERGNAARLRRTKAKRRMT